MIRRPGARAFLHVRFRHYPEVLTDARYDRYRRRTRRSSMEPCRFQGQC